MSIHGGPPIVLADSSQVLDGASWGPDDTIVFATLTNEGLLRVSAGGGVPETLTTLEEGEVAHRWPHFLPGGRSLLFTIITGLGSEHMEIAALDLDTKEIIRLIPGGGNPR